MMIPRFKPEQQKQAIWFLFISAQVSFLLSAVLGRPSFSWLNAWLSPGSIDFISGFLLGYEIVAMMGFLACTGKLFKLHHKG
jgi:hypothetical protein